ncbi:MAG: NAD(P)-dependent oxidoreductase, partial [Phyllobacterium sp.]
MRIFLFGAGYSARTFARRIADQADFIGGTTRDSSKLATLDGEGITPFLFHGTHAPQEIKDALATIT